MERNFDLRISESEEQIRRLEEQLKKKRARKMELERQKKQQQQKEREKWLQQMTGLLDTMLLCEAGELYWEAIMAKNIVQMVRLHLPEILEETKTQYEEEEKEDESERKDETG